MHSTKMNLLLRGSLDALFQKHEFLTQKHKSEVQAKNQRIVELEQELECAKKLSLLDYNSSNTKNAMSINNTKP